MGLPKATLPFGSEFMLQRVHRLLSEVVRPIVVVVAEGQPLPGLPTGTLYACDQRPDRGPLEGLLAGMKAIEPVCDLAYVTSCDVPLLQPSLVRQLLQLTADFDAVAPRQEEFCHPLSAVYQTRIIPTIEKLLARDLLRASNLLQQIRTRYIPVDDLRLSDPNLLTLRNLNRPEEYFEALAVAGFEIDPTIKAGLLAK
ncbi:molybdopterin-guanine dinucleotide biosynthesis protein MobA [Anatilimnocola aggregata]|uniref:Molybdopterin-guanine dinucleotide biosynthesis protein MobA n=2 Tax=Anatilimnocola aggregata TaxID=2528021 RepID=A0A517YIF8_9BACT|nr:molybdopterin-guanine dinucleotide biosynthesis protein MobA [Anatilimnocola aggregata]